MATTLATGSDAELILKLYELRREERMRAARLYVIGEFQPTTFEQMMEVYRGLGSNENAYWRQVLTYWEMAHSFVLRGAIDADLFLDTQFEGIFIYAKFAMFHDAFQEATGNVFMRQTAALIEKYPAARERFDGFVKMHAERRAAAAKA